MANGLNVRVGRTELQPEGSDLVFIHPYAGKGTYAKVMGEIDAAGLIRPTFDNNVVLADAAWKNPKEKYSAEIIGLMKSDWLIADTALFYIPNEGVYVQDHPKTDGNRWPVMDKNDLVSRLKSKDPSVRFTKFGYKTGEMSQRELAKNKFVRALTGSDKGAQMVAKVAGKYSDAPYLAALSADEVIEQETRIAALDSDYGGDWLGVDGDFRGDYSYGFAFGVAQSGEASAQK